MPHCSAAAAIIVAALLYYGIVLKHRRRPQSFSEAYGFIGADGFPLVNEREDAPELNSDIDLSAQEIQVLKSFINRIEKKRKT